MATQWEQIAVLQEQVKVINNRLIDMSQLVKDWFKAQSKKSDAHQKILETNMEHIEKTYIKKEILKAIYGTIIVVVTIVPAAIVTWVKLYFDHK